MEVERRGGGLGRQPGRLPAHGRAQLASIQIAEHKARTAATFRREKKVFENAIQQSNFHYVMTLDGVIASRGGIPLVQNWQAHRRDRLLRRDRLAGRGRLQGRCCDHQVALEIRRR